MPRTSDRMLVLKELEKVIRTRQVEAAFRIVARNDSDTDDDGTMLSEIIDVTIEQARDTIQGRRYFYDRKPYRTGFSKETFERDLQAEDLPDGTSPWLTDEEFLQKYRMHRDSFQVIVSLIQNHPVFQSKGKRKQAPIQYQLLVFLYYIGTEGSGASSPRCRQVFGIGRGTCNIFRKRVRKFLTLVCRCRITNQ